MQFFFETLQTFFCPRKYEKNLSQKLLIISPIIFQLAPNQPKSHTLFHKNGSLRDFYMMTLATPRYDGGRTCVQASSKLASPRCRRSPPSNICARCSNLVRAFVMLNEDDDPSLRIHQSCQEVQNCCGLV
jgi:hypothetical protein